MPKQTIAHNQSEQREKPQTIEEQCQDAPDPNQTQQSQRQGTYWRPALAKSIKPPDKHDPVERRNRNRQIKTLTRCLSRHPAFKDLDCHKPKQSVNLRLKTLSENIAARSSLAPAILHVFKRYIFSLDPSDDIERGLFRAFDKMTDAQRDALKDTVKAFEVVPDYLQHLVFNPKFIDLPIDQPISPNELAEEVTIEILKHGMQEQYPRASVPLTGCIPGRVRPKEFGAPDHFLPIPTVTPNVCTIQGLRRAGFHPRPDWDDTELMRECYVDREGDTVRSRCDDYITREEGCPDGFTETEVCLRVPTVRVGGTVDISGYNFISADCQVQMQRLDDPSQEWFFDACVLGDQETPLREPVDGRLRYIADCRVEDHVVFTVPLLRDGINEFLPGDYRLRVRVRNPGEHRDEWRATDPTPPEFLLSGWHLIHVVPRADIPYRITLDDVICDEETDGIGSDDVYIRFLVHGVHLPDPGPPADSTTPGSPGTIWPLSFESFHAPDPWRNEDVDSGETFLGNRILFNDVFPDILAIAMLGYEVDDEEVLKQGIMEFGDAFVYALEQLWTVLATYLVARGTDDISSLYDEVGLGWTVVIIGVAIALTLGIAALWAVWAPPDPIITDLVVLPAEMMHYLTYPRNPIIGAYEVGTINGIRVTVLPETKLANDYIEARRYRSEDEDSTYRLRLRYTR